MEQLCPIKFSCVIEVKGSGGRGREGKLVGVMWGVNSAKGGGGCV